METIDLTLFNKYQVLETCKELINIDKDVLKNVEYIVNRTHVTYGEALDYTVNMSPKLWAKIYLNWDSRDYQEIILEQGSKTKQLVLRLGRRLGKCLPGDAKIPDPITGEVKTVKELFDAQQCNIYTMSDNFKIKNTETNIIFANGIKPVYLVKTNSGKEIRATGNHPLYTINGYKEIDELKIGDYVATPSKLIVEKPKNIDINELKLLAYMIGDGNCTQKSIRFSSIEPEIIKEMTDITETFNCEFKQYSYNLKQDYHIIKKSGKTNDITAILRKYNLFGKDSHEKCIPKEVFSVSDKQLAIFLSRLFATDGWATSSFNKKPRVEIGYCSVNKQLIKDIQHLLLRFEIHSSIVEKKVKYKKGINIAYQLVICNSTSVIKFADKINIYSKEKAVKKSKKLALTMQDRSNSIPVGIYDIIEEKCNLKGIKVQSLRYKADARIDRRYETINRERIKKVAEYLNDKELMDIYESEIYWEKIVSIEYVGHMETYDLTVPVTHNFVADDFITHNTESMCILILWYAYTQINKGPNENQYDIVIITPYENQIDLIFDRLHQLIDMSPMLKQEIKRDVYHRLEWVNGTKIQGFTAGTKNNSGAANIRGIRADLLILDEADYLSSSDITNIINIRNEAPDRIRLIVASTPCGKHEEYYYWCTNASKKYHPKEQDIKNYVFTGYETTDNKKGNGFVEVYAPSVVNKELLKINPDTGVTYLEDLKNELTELRFLQEVMAEFGDEQMGVYKKQYIEAAVKEGLRINHKYTTEYTDEELKKFLDFPRFNPRILGVDNDKTQAGCNLVCIELDKIFRDEANNVVPMFKVLFRVEIPQTQFTYIEEINKIIELNDEYDFDYIAMDKGYGETQIELLHKYGMENPYTGLHEKVIGYQFSEKIIVRDPYTTKPDKKPFKPFMVNNSVNVFEKYKIIFNPSDKKMIEQFEQYRIKSISNAGLPIYTDENEHIVDATNLALLMFEQKYGELFKNVLSTKILQLHGITKEGKEKSRDFFIEEAKKDILPIKNGYIEITRTDVRDNSLRRGINKKNIPQRRTF